MNEREKTGDRQINEPEGGIKDNDVINDRVKR